MSKIYVVINGVIPGIYDNWDITKKQVNGYPGSVYKSFTNINDAEKYSNSYGKSFKDLEDFRGKKIIPVQEKIQSDKILEISKNFEKMEMAKIPEPINMGTELVIYTDGSCKDKKGGCGILYMYNGKIIEEMSIKVNEYPTTNNRAELLAIYCSLKYKDDVLTKNGIKDNKTICIYTDSEYSITAMTNYDIWERKNFKLSNGDMAKNIDIIKEIKKLLSLEPYDVKFIHVYSHATDIYNNMVDILAKKGCS
jgi:ribonuclease HI